MPWYKTGWFTATCGVATIASLVFAFWTYFVSVRERVPTFSLAGSRSTIVNAANDAANDLTVSYKGQPIRGSSVTALQIYFWNDGKEVIRKDDVLKPLRISMPANTKILRATIVTSSRDVCNFHLAQSDGDQNNIWLNFDVAEHNDGARIQLVFAGDPTASPSYSGVIIGSSRPDVQKSKEERDSRSLALNAWVQRHKNALIAIMFCFIIMTRLFISLKTASKMKFWPPDPMLIITLLAVVLNFYMYRPPSVPSSLLDPTSGVSGDY